MRCGKAAGDGGAGGRSVGERGPVGVWPVGDGRAKVDKASQPFQPLESLAQRGQRAIAHLAERRRAPSERHAVEAPWPPQQQRTKERPAHQAKQLLELRARLGRLLTERLGDQCGDPKITGGTRIVAIGITLARGRRRRREQRFADGFERAHFSGGEPARRRRRCGELSGCHDAISLIVRGAFGRIPQPHCTPQRFVTLLVRRLKKIRPQVSTTRRARSGRVAEISAGLRRRRARENQGAGGRDTSVARVPRSGQALAARREAGRCAHTRH